MIDTKKISPFIFNPLWPVMLYLFMAITNLHAQIPFLLNIHLETLTLCWVLITSAMMFFLTYDEKANHYKNPALIALILGMLFITAPMISSLSNQSLMAALDDEEFRTLFKMILFTPCFILLMKDTKKKEILLNSLILFYVIFAFYFLYRYLILHEVRDFDQRPQLKIRNGDANFLCTFFSMIIPLALMQAFSAWQKKDRKLTLVFLLAAGLLIFCTFLTESRMGLIATLLGLLYLLTRPLFAGARKFLIGLFVIAVTVIAVSNGDRLISRFSSFDDKSNSDRYLTWVNGAQILIQNPLLGIGMHNAKKSFYQNTAYPHFQSESKELEVHNTFLKAAAELGLIGFGLFGMMFLWPWKKSLALHTPERFFLLCSMIILTLSSMTIGIVYKDLFVLHLFSVSALAIYASPNIRLN